MTQAALFHQFTIFEHISSPPRLLGIEAEPTQPLGRVGKLKGREIDDPAPFLSHKPSFITKLQSQTHSSGRVDESTPRRDRLT
jgi:hypothetical protein